MRTIFLLLAMTLLSWQNPLQLTGEVCESQMITLYRFAVPVAVVMILLDIFNFIARLLERRQRRELEDYEWVEQWVSRHFAKRALDQIGSGYRPEGR